MRATSEEGCAELEGALPRERPSARWAGFDVSEQLLRVLSSALDVREVFPRVSEVACCILPHDRLTMSFHDGMGTCVLQAIEQVLRECQGNKSKAARRLGLTRKQLYVRLRQYDLEPA